MNILLTLTLLFWGFSTQASSNLTEEDFNEVVSSIQSFYGPIFESQGKKLIIKANFNNTYSWGPLSEQREEQSIIQAFGGIAQFRYASKDTFLLTLCHEVGHFLGGTPRIEASNWASAEGQADCFATSKCFPEILKNDRENELVDLKLVPLSAQKACADKFSERDGYSLCLRSVLASIEVAKLSLELVKGKIPENLSVDKPDKKKVKKTNVFVNGAQCRLDTFYQGSLQGSRPRCWFVP